MRIVIPGKPIAKKRPRFSVLKGKDGKPLQDKKSGRAITRTYNEQESEEGLFALELRRQWQRPPLQGPVELCLLFCLPRPKGHYGTGRNAGKLKPSAPAFHVKKPDCDNMVKFVKDCANTIVWKDDNQVCELVALKRYTESYQPRTEVMVRELGA